MDVLDLIGVELQRAARRRSELLRTQPRRRCAAAWLLAAPHDGRRRAGWRSPRLLAVVLATLAGSAGVAYAAARLAGVGAPAPASSNPTLKLYVGTRTELLSLRAPDPAGGPPWGLQLAFEAHTLNVLAYGAAPAICVQIGRIVGGRIGYLGEYGAFHDDGLFHAASIASGLLSSCDTTRGSTIPSISSLGFSGSGAIVANGLSGCRSKRSPTAVEPPYWRSLSPAKRATLGRARARAQRQQAARTQRYLDHQLAVLRHDGAEARAIAKRRGVSVATLVAVVRYYIAQTKAGRQGSSEFSTIQACPAQAVRRYWIGFAGADAVSESLDGEGLHLTERVNPHDNGAYLFVLAGPQSRWQGVYTTVTCANGHTYVHSQACPQLPPGPVGRELGYVQASILKASAMTACAKTAPAPTNNAAPPATLRSILAVLTHPKQCTPTSCYRQSPTARTCIRATCDWPELPRAATGTSSLPHPHRPSKHPPAWRPASPRSRPLSSTASTRCPRHFALAPRNCSRKSWTASAPTRRQRSAWTSSMWVAALVAVARTPPQSSRVATSDPRAPPTQAR